MEKLVVGILAHVDAGKTTLSEGILYLTGKIRKLGRVDHKDAYLDTYNLERERGITIFSKQAEFELGNRGITLLDTPGHVDFSAEMERTLQVLDYAILVINGADKAVGTEDILYWLCCAFFVFSEIYRSNEGILRFFMVLGFLSGAYICHRILGDIFVKCCTKFMEIPVIIIKFLIKWLLFPVKRCKLLWYKAYKCAKKGRLANWVILRKGRKKRK